MPPSAFPESPSAVPEPPPSAVPEPVEGTELVLRQNYNAFSNLFLRFYLYLCRRFEKGGIENGKFVAKNVE